MATTRIYLDNRFKTVSGLFSLKLSISHKGKTVRIPLEIKLTEDQWNRSAEKVVKHPNRQYLNTEIAKRKMEFDEILFHLRGKDRMTASDLKRIILREIAKDENGVEEYGSFYSRFIKYVDLKNNQGTKSIYLQTWSRIKAFDENAENLRFEDVDKEWLQRFDNFMSKTARSRNARNVHFRNIRAVFNDALDDEVITCYPFRKFKIRPAATAKRSLTVEQLRTFFNASTEPHSEKYLDAFKLIFFLIGINVTDLCHLTKIRDGRVEYERAKTHRFYSIKVEPEAAAIINKYKGEKFLLSIVDRYENPSDYLRRLNRAIKKIGPVTVGKQGKKIYEPLFPEISTYWARHTWATLAAKLDIPKETIAAALGHGGNKVTDIYIDFDRDKIDEANRRVIDYVLYGK